MSAFVISLVVVAAAVVVAIRVVLTHATEPDKPATAGTERVRGTIAPTVSGPVVVPRPADWTHDPLAPSTLRRIRSAVLLVAIVTVLGALTALLLVIGGAILLTGVRGAVQ